MTMRPYSRRAARRALGVSWGVVARRFPRIGAEADDGQEQSERRVRELGIADPMSRRALAKLMPRDGYR